MPLKINLVKSRKRKGVISAINVDKVLAEKRLKKRRVVKKTIFRKLLHTMRNGLVEKVSIEETYYGGFSKGKVQILDMGKSVARLFLTESYSLSWGRVLVLSNLSVNKEYRREKFFAQILQEAKSVAQKYNQRSLVLNVSASNFSAIKAYEKLGFVATRRKPVSLDFNKYFSFTMRLAL